MFVRQMARKGPRHDDMVVSVWHLHKKMPGFWKGLKRSMKLSPQLCASKRTPLYRLLQDVVYEDLLLGNSTIVRASARGNHRGENEGGYASVVLVLVCEFLFVWLFSGSITILRPTDQRRKSSDYWIPDSCQIVIWLGLLVRATI